MQKILCQANNKQTAIENAAADAGMVKRNQANKFSTRFTYTLVPLTFDKKAQDRTFHCFFFFCSAKTAKRKKRESRIH